MKVGPFYYYKNTIIAPENYQKQVDLATFARGTLGVEGYAGEHRDIWDNYMLVNYPELKTDYNDNHKALPRGRVDIRPNKGSQRKDQITEVKENVSEAGQS